MPWYCARCTRWNPSRYLACPACGRPARGRLCRRCRQSAPKDALFCTNCGSDSLSEPGGTLRLSRRLRWGLALAGVSLAWLTVYLVAPWVVLAGVWVCGLMWRLALYAAVFVLLTALPPRPWGQRLRGAAWWVVRFLFRTAGNLVG